MKASINSQWTTNSMQWPRKAKEHAPSLLKDPFTVDNDLLTPTMKTKRNIAKKHFEAHEEAEIAKMYEERKAWSLAQKIN